MRSTHAGTSDVFHTSCACVRDRDVFQQDARCVPTRCAMCSNKMRSTHAARGIVEQARQQDAFHTRWNKRANKMRSTHTARGTVEQARQQDAFHSHSTWHSGWEGHVLQHRE